LTTVPNLQGVNGFLQRLGDRRTYEAHVVYDAAGLARVHREAGLEILASGYAGFCDAWVTRGGEHPLRARLHAALCRNLGRGAAAWTRLLRDRATPEWRFLAPHVYCAGRRA
jgi:hypothetical protein